MILPSCFISPFIARVYNGSKPELFVADPEILKAILIKDFDLFPNRRPIKASRFYEVKSMVNARDDQWRRIRRVVRPTFTTGKIKKEYRLIEECVDCALEGLDRMIDKTNNNNIKGEVDIKQLYGCLTMDVIARVAFATKTNSHDVDTRVPNG